MDKTSTLGGKLDLIKVVIAEDDEVLRKQLIAIISAMEGFDVIYFTGCGSELLKVLKKAKPDLVISDINMPKITGIEAIRAVRQELPDTEIVFITAYDNFIKEAVQLYAFDFIQKPLVESRLQETLERIKRRLKTHESLIEFKSEGSVMVVRTKELYFIEAVKKKTIIYTEVGNFTSNLSLKEVEGILKEEYFFKTSRSYFVNLKKVRGLKPISRTSFEVNFDKKGYVAYLSKNRYEEFRINLKKYFC